MAKIDQEVQSKFESEKFRMITNIIYTASWIKGRFNTMFAPFDLSIPQFNILRILKGGGDWMAMSDVKSRMVEKSPNATRLVDKMIAKELIDRQRSEEDRRVVYIKINTKGLNLLKEVDAIDQSDILSFIANISEEEAKVNSDILDKLRG